MLLALRHLRRFSSSSAPIAPIATTAKTFLNLSFVQIDAAGNIGHIRCTSPKKEFCLENHLEVRDLRQLEVASRSPTQYPPSLLSRGKSIFVNLICTKAIIQCNCAKFFDSSLSSALGDPMFFQSLLDDLSEQLKAKNGERFEIVVLECLLDHMSAALCKRLDTLQTSVDSLLVLLERRVDRENLKSLLLYNKSLTSFQSIATSIRDAIEDLLHSPADMQAMYLHTEADTVTDPAEELELLLEHFLRIVDEVVGRVDDLLLNIQSTEGISNIVLDSQRNALLRMDLRLSMGGFAFGVAGLGAAFFGMNLHSGLESRPGGMGVVVLGLSGLAVGVLVGCWRKMNAVIRSEG